MDHHRRLVGVRVLRGVSGRLAFPPGATMNLRGICRQTVERYGELLRDPTTRVPVLVITVVMLVCWALFLYVALEALLT
jgi:hypothetical protein